MLLLPILVLICKLSGAQQVSPQSNTWNSTFTLTPSQILQAGLDEDTANNLNIALRFERTNWAGSSVSGDKFYTPPPNSSHLPPGTLLAREDIVNTSLYTLPPNTALSRILFQSETFNGSTIPASAYILWPWMPREDPQNPGKYSVVVWAHGTSCIMAECAPSHIRNLWLQYTAPFTLALQGYVVVAPDYAGLGVSRHADGRKIKNVYLSSSDGNDMLHSVKAAQSAFPELSERFVLLGHSQGGHAVWSAAQKLAEEPVEGYLGGIAAAPATDLASWARQDPAAAGFLAFLIAYGVDEILPDFEIAEWLTEKGVKHLHLFRDVQGCNSALSQTVTEPGLVKPDLVTSARFQQYSNLVEAGGRPFAGPMLVMQGLADSRLSPNTTSFAVDKTCRNDSTSQLEYATFEGVDHDPVMYAGQRVWLDWIADRFAGRPAAAPCTRRLEKPARPVESYQKQLGFYLELATQAYQVA